MAARWEWRTFGDDFGGAEDRLSALTPDRVGETDEVYLVSPTSDVSVKVRDGTLDMKERIAVADDGLEQWRPVVKQPFPVAVPEAQRVFDALEVAVRIVPVHKRRTHYLLDGCMVELTDLSSGEAGTRTIAIEAEDPELVRTTVRELGLEGRRVMCMARGLKALVAFGGVRYAAIDVGTNSVKLTVGEREQDGSWHDVLERAEVTRLGEGLAEGGALGDEPIKRTAEAIGVMADEAREAGAVEIVAAGTAGMRMASNASALIDAVKERAGVEIEVIPGDEEARLAYTAVVAALPEKPASLVVFDTGGGSSQFTFADEQFSVNVGAARFTERFGLDQPVSADVVAEAREAIAAELTRIQEREKPDMVVGMGGAVTNLTAVKEQLAEYDPAEIQGTVLERSEVERQIELYRERTADERREIAGLQPKRAEVILAGACIVATVLDLLGRDSLTVSARGLRHGLLAERFGVS
jgi:exopolyphosphatase / guanosine-5'-triphosphate,3'-diphosphate pyrophosphatase